jgi:hypothetical protein
MSDGEVENSCWIYHRLLNHLSVWPWENAVPDVIDDIVRFARLSLT